ncbi:hypothetical protein DPEC_G00204440 [Dallia pectoralis]|uniref:Uncharacterized protein n=1 Tax=Dallia pectoralis TaxID=75939 RepID=A0ACC2G9X1_DALPE|nr:hypothetical protein DPEC_G00204440 [Dallia pectoralis]
MNKLVFVIMALVASVMLAESLTCNQCSVGLVGLCLKPSTIVCTTNTSSCFTGKGTFPSVPLFSGFNSQGCLENVLCNNSTNTILLGATFTTTTLCCNTTQCNPVTFSGASSVKLTVSTAIGAALVASMWSCMLN